MALFSTFLLSNIDSSILFNYRFPTLRLELSIGNRWRYSLLFFLLFFYRISIRLYVLTIDFQPWARLTERLIVIK